MQIKVNFSFLILFFATLIFSAWIGISSPLAQLIERPDNPALKPLDFGLSANSNDIVVSPDDLFFVINDQDQLYVISTEDFSLFDPQPAVLEARTESYDFLSNSQSLFVHRTDAFLNRVIVDDPLNDLLSIDLTASIATGAGRLVVDPESIDNQLFILTFSNNTIYEFNIAPQTIGNSVVVTSDITVTPTNMTYIFFPTTNGQGGEIDRIAVTTNQGRVVFYDESLNLVSTLILANTNADCPSAAGNPDSNLLPSSAVNTIRDLLFVVNSTDNVVHVVDTISMTELADSPICLRQVQPGIDRDINNNLRDIVATRVNDPANAPRGFVTGDLGVTILNTTRDDLGVIDAFDTDGENPAFIESIPLSATPLDIDASSQSDGYLYTTNEDHSVSVISDKPFVTIASIDPDTLNEANSSFTLTFQVDELCEGCAYRVRAGGDIDESGTLLLENTYTAAEMMNVDLTTPAIDINGFPEGTFVEGQNQIFVFSTDAAGNVGRDSVFVTVDTPPPDVEILSTGFGNTRGFVTIRRLTQDDIAQYNIYVLEALDQGNPVCPGGLDFSVLAEPTATVPQPGSGDDVSIRINNLTNGIAYCVGVQAQDNAGNRSANITVSTEAIIPEVTVGITGFSGETGCRLQTGSASKFGLTWLGWAFLSMVFLGLRFSKNRKFWITTLVAMSFTGLLSAREVQAIEVTDQHWAAQFQGGFFLPMGGAVDQFLDTCCNPTFQLTFGRIFKNQFEVNLGVGFMSKGADAIGVNTQRVSAERFNFTVVPISNSFVYRADYVENQILVPYVSVGLDYMYFRENLQGNVTQGFKFGYHAAAGVQFLMEWIDSVADGLEEYGINDVYLTFEGKWQQIDNFGGGGLDFKGITAFAGILFLF